LPLEKTFMSNRRTILAAWFLMLVASGYSSAALAQAADAPYGAAKFNTYGDIAELKQLKVVWDFNFTNPNAVGFVFNYVNALLTATAEFGPHEIDPIKVVIVSHGPELVIFARKNYEKYKDVVDRAARFSRQGVKFEICRNAAAFLGFVPEDFHGFVTVVPPAPYALAYWQAKGYALNAVGATMPTTPLSDLNRGDTNRRSN
jgi:intracellular sulfur oxidation DsrE/DsrF family protein